MAHFRAAAANSYFCQLLASIRMEDIECMVATTLPVHDDTKFFERALQEYREAVGDYSTFLDLPRETQQQVLVRAQQLRDYAPAGWHEGCKRHDVHAE